MSSSLTGDEASLESPLNRDQDTEVTVKFKISKEALAQLVPPNTSRRQFEEGFTLLLLCGVYTRIQDLRELQHTEAVAMYDGAGNVIVPAMRRKEALRRAGRLAQIALTELEDAALWADKAALQLR